MYLVKNRAPKLHAAISPISISATIKLVTVCLVIAAVPVALYVRVHSMNSKGAVTVQAAGRGEPYFHFRDGKEVAVEYRGRDNFAVELQSGNAQPRALAAIDFDRDGTPDIAAGYSYNGMGFLAIQHGNPDAFAPRDESVYASLNQGYDPESLLPVADVLAVPEAVDFLQVGDFNHDNQRDVLVAASGGGMFLLAGDGYGGLRAAEPISLPGKVTCLTAGEFRAPDGWTDVAVGINGPDGPEMLVFDGATAMKAEPMHWSLPAPATAAEFGEMDDTPFHGLAVATGNEVEIIHGWGRKQSPALASRVESVDACGNVRGLASGFFVWTREASAQIAALTEDGTIQILVRDQANTQPFNDEELTARARLRLKQTKAQVDIETVPSWNAAGGKQWKKIREIPTSSVVGADASAQNLLQRSHISFMSTDDFMVLDSNQPRLKIVRQFDAKAGNQPNTEMIAGDMVVTTLDTVAPTAAVLPLPQKLNGQRSLLMLQSGNAGPTVVPLAPTATILVDRTDDPNGGALAAASVCGAGANDCSLRGAVQFANLSSGTVITFPAGAQTYVLSTNGADGCVHESLTTGNTIGDLEVNATTTFTGNGAANTVISQQSAAMSPTNDRVLCMDVTLAPGFTFAFAGITFTGGRDFNTNVGGGGFIGGARNTTLNLTNVTFANNQTTGPNISGGGGVAVTGGDMNVTNCTFGAANLPGANRNDLTLGNAVNNNSGGGLSYSAGDPLGIGGATGTLTVTGTTFTHNTSSSGAAGGGGMDVFDFNTSTGINNVSTSSFISNQATVANGGGIVNESAILNISSTSFTNNSAANRGGGIYVAGGLGTTLNGTTPSIVFSGNTATIAGSSVSTAGTVTVSGTNTTIGGSIEVTGNGIWINSAGSVLSPTDVVIAGGTFNMNNSTMNVGGNFSLGPSGNNVIPGTFNGNTGTVNLAGTFTYSNVAATVFNAGTGTFNFNGSGAQSITNNASITFNNLTDSNTTQPLVANNSFAVNGTLNINGANAIFAPVAAAVISGTGTLTGTGTARVTRTGADSFFSQYTITNKTLTNLTVEYIGAAAQTASTTTYGNLKITNASGVTLNAGTTTVNGTLTLQTGPLAVSTNTLVINNGINVVGGSLTSSPTGTVNYNQSSAGQTVITANYGNLTFSAFTKVLPSSGTVGIAGTFNPNGVTTGHTITGSTLDFNATGAQTVPVFNYNNLTISGARGGATVTLGAGTIGVAGTFNPSATGVVYTITGNTFDFNGAGAQTIPAFNYNNLTISGNRAVAITLGNGNVGIAGTFNPSITGNTWTANPANTVVFNGAALQTIPAFAFFNGLTLNNAAGANLAGNVTVLNALALNAGALGVGTNTLTLNGAASFGAGTLTSSPTGTVIYNQQSNGQATVLAANYGNLTFSNFSKTLASTGTIGIAGVFTPGSGTGHTITGSTINFNGAGTQTIPGFTYNNLTSSGGAVARTLDPVNTIKIAGVFTPGTNVYTITGSTIEYNGGAVQVLPATFITYNNLTLNNITSVTGFAGLTVQGLIRVQAGTFTSSSIYNNVQIDAGATMVALAGSTINVSGNWSNSGTFTAGNGTVVFNGNDNTQTLSGNTTFSNLTINHTGTGNVTAVGSTLAASGLLRIQGGTFISASTFNNVQIDSGTTLQGTNATTMNVSGSWTNNGGTFTPNGNTVNFNGAGAQGIGGSSTTQTFDNFTVNKTGGSTLTVTASANTLDINGNVILTSGIFAAGTANAITVAGNWTNNGATFTPGAGTVTFDGGAGQAIGGTTATTFNNLTTGNANGIAMNNDNTVNGILALTSGDITVAATKTLTQPAAGSSTGTFDVNGRVQRSGFVGGALSFGNPFNTIQVTAGTAPANVVVDLARSVPTGGQGFPTAVQRTYLITPNTTAFTATVRLHYLSGELNGNDPTLLNLWRFDNTLPRLVAKSDYLL